MKWLFNLVSYTDLETVINFVKMSQSLLRFNLDCCKLSNLIFQAIKIQEIYRKIPINFKLYEYFQYFWVYIYVSFLCARHDFWAFKVITAMILFKEYWDI